MSFKKGYVPWNKGKHGIYSEETKKKMSLASTGRYHTEETKRKIGNANRNKIPSKETIKKLSESHKGKHPSEATRKKMSESHSGEKHPLFGKHLTKELRKKMSEKKKGKPNPLAQNEKHPQWKGDDVGYFGLHKWVKRHKPKVERCEECNKKKPLEIANISGEYKRDINDFQWLCHKCHLRKDLGKN